MAYQEKKTGKQLTVSLEKPGIKKVDKEELWSKSDTSSATHSKSIWLPEKKNPKETQ